MIAELTIGERIKEIENFLEDQEETPAPIPLAPITIPTDVLPTPITPTPIINNNEEVIKILNRILINQLIERKSYERNNPLITDIPIYDWLEIETPAGYIVTFTLTVPEGFLFFFDYFNITYAPNTIFNITIDGVAESPVTDPVQDWGNHAPFFNPPRICQDHVIITALNDGTVDQTYGCFMRGFFRQSIKIDKDYIGAR